MAGYGYGISVSGSRTLAQSVASAPLIPSDGLSLWLKGDAGVSLFSFDYKSRLVLSGAVSGTFDATSVPTYDFGNGRPSDYDLDGGASTISWNDFEGGSFSITTASITLQGVTTNAGYISYNGLGWETFGNWTTPPSISGLTNDYSSGNGQYAFTESNPYDNSKVLDVDGNIIYSIIGSSGNWQLFYQNTDTSEYFQIASNSNDLPNGTWTMLVEEQGIAFGTGSAYGTNPTPPTTVSSITSNVNTNSVTTWADQSGNARNASQSSSTPPAYNLIGGKSFISFNAFVDLLISSPIWGTFVPFIGTIFTVARFPSSSAGGNARLFSAEADINYFIFGRGIDSTNAFFVTNNQEDYATSSPNVGNNTNFILATTFDEDASIYLNGTLAGDTSLSSNFAIGNEFIGGGEEPSSIAEIVVYNRVLTTQERQQVEQYLNSKYQVYPWRVTISGAGTTTSNGEYVWDGVTLDSGKPRYTNPSGNYIYWDDTWYIYDNTTESATYLISSSDFSGAWVENDGSLPVPTSTLSYTP
jgi:hypothetical protein